MLIFIIFTIDSLCAKCEVLSKLEVSFENKEILLSNSAMLFNTGLSKLNSLTVVKQGKHAYYTSMSSSHFKLFSKIITIEIKLDI